CRHTPAVPVSNDSCAKENRRGEPRRWGIPGASQESPGFQRRETLLREEDLDAPVLRLTHTRSRRHARIVHATTDDSHVGARDAEGGERIRYSISPSLGEPLVVAGRAREVGVTRDLEPHRTTSPVLLRCE